MRGVPRWRRTRPRQREEQEGGGKRGGLQGFENCATEKSETAGPRACARKMIVAARRQPTTEHWRCAERVPERVSSTAVDFSWRDAAGCDRNGRAPRSCLVGDNPKHRFKIIVFPISSRYTARVTRMNKLGKSASASAVNREYLALAWIG